jgi:hypothetical protein
MRKETRLIVAGLVLAFIGGLTAWIVQTGGAGR